MHPTQLAAHIRRLGAANDTHSIAALLTDLQQRWPADADALVLRSIVATKFDWIAPAGG